MDLMLRAIACLRDEHDPVMVAIAFAICAIGCLIAMRIMVRVQDVSGRRARVLWCAAGALAFGCSVWSTHFLAMLAHGATPVGTFDIGPTLASLVLAMAGAGAGFAIAAIQGGRAIAASAGLMLAATIAAMHFTGMAALVLPAEITYDRATVGASIGIGAALAVGAVLAVRERRCVVAAALMLLGVFGFHFTAMSAVSIVPWRDPIGMSPTVPNWGIAIAVAAASLMVLMVELVGMILEESLARRTAREAQRLQAFADATFEGIVFYRDGEVRDTNAAFRALRGDICDLAGTQVDALFASPLLAGQVHDDPDTGQTVQEAELVTNSGGRRVVEVLHRTIERDGLATGVLVLRDVTQRKTAEQQIERLAHFDTLTGLANRRLFRDRLAQALAAAQRLGSGVALLLLDLDRFKAVNDLLGHATGDELLATAANRLVVASREMDTAARLGGDEFAVVMTGATQSTATQLAQRLIEALSAPYTLANRKVSIGASVGIALFPLDGHTPERLLRNADLALHRAKQSGGGCMRFFEEETDLKRQQRARLEQDLRLAISNEALSLHYQPLRDAATLRLVGYEALLRWQHPEHGAIGPAVFVPIAEECGLIVALSEWVLRTACREAATWPAGLTVAVNLSPALFAAPQLRQDGLVEMVGDVLAQTGLAPRQLELEVTEGILIKDPERTVTILRALGGLGVRIAMDDFGTGYSSLSYLRLFQFDKIKIDRSFIASLGADRSTDTIAAAIIGLGHGLNLTVTAEGVETEEQLAQLRALRCDQVQGYLVGRPVAAERLNHAEMTTESA